MVYEVPRDTFEDGLDGFDEWQDTNNVDPQWDDLVTLSDQARLLLAQMAAPARG